MGLDEARERYGARTHATLAITAGSNAIRGLKKNSSLCCVSVYWRFSNLTANLSIERTRSGLRGDVCRKQTATLATRTIGDGEGLICHLLIWDKTLILIGIFRHKALERRAGACV